MTYVHDPLNARHRQGQGHHLERIDADDERITHHFGWVDNLDLNDSNAQIRVHFLDYQQIGPKKTQHFTWITAASPINRSQYCTRVRSCRPDLSLA